MTYEDLKDAFKKLDTKYIALPVIIGGGDDYWHFTGFDLVGPEDRTRPLTGYDVIRILESLPAKILKQEIPMHSYEPVIEEDFWGDLNEITIGPLRARCAWVAAEDAVYPLEDYCDNTPADEINLLMHEQYSTGVMLLPETRIVITVSDGSMITDDSECIILKR